MTNLLFDAKNYGKKSQFDPQDPFTQYRLKLKMADEYKNQISPPLPYISDDNKRKVLQRLGIKLKQKKSSIQQQKSAPTLTRVGEIIENLQDEKLKKSHQIPEKYRVQANQETLSLSKTLKQSENAIILHKNRVVAPTWHPKWRLMRVLSGHTGWVRCVSVDPTNSFFVTGSNDRTIKFWDLISGQLRTTLTGHISAVRGVEISPRHPYAFSCGQDKKIFCWDLQQNKIVRHYHGHLSGIFCIKLHPQLDVLVTGGRDSTARVWDMRTKAQVHVLGGHKHTVECVAMQRADPQVITGSHDTTVKLWDIGQGKCIQTLTRHKKGVKSIVIHKQEFSFCSAGADKLRMWQLPDGDQIRKMHEHQDIINAIALNDDNVLVSGGNAGQLCFWDWSSGTLFDRIPTIIQPGSLACEAGIFGMTFDRSGLRLITAECDKTIKMYRETAPTDEMNQQQY